MPDHHDLANLVWQIADLLRGPYTPPQYERVMLPMTVLRRFDCVLAGTKDKVLAEYANRKEKRRKGKIQLLDARSFWQPGGSEENRRSLGDKRRHISTAQISQILDLYDQRADAQHSKTFDNADFGYTRVTVERPLRDEAGVIQKDKHGKPKPDAKLRDFENVPLKEDIDAYFQREVLPHVPDAWMDRSKDKVGYEINFNRHFYQFTPPRDLAVIDAEIEQAEKEFMRLFKEVTR